MKEKEFEDDIVFAKFINYMQKALLHRKINYIRDKKRILEIECSIYDFENKLFAEEKVETNFFDVLNEKEQQVLKLHISERLTYKEISNIINLQPESIRKIKYRALKKIENRGKGEHEN